MPVRDCVKHDISNKVIKKEGRYAHDKKEKKIEMVEETWQSGKKKKGKKRERDEDVHEERKEYIKCRKQHTYEREEERDKERDTIKKNVNKNI